ncbi:hypothetical protein BDV98DRAFT_493359, partial [Pterulicium gracile]
LLHIPDMILRLGPMWTYWNYPTKRFCGFMVRASKSQKNPYVSFVRRMQELLFNNQIKYKYRLHDFL